MATVLVIGCGGIGFRHAQAACAAGVESVLIVEPNPERAAWASAELSSAKPSGAVSVFPRLEHMTQEHHRTDIVISAVTADVFADIAEPAIALDAKAFLFEKPIAQSQCALDALLSATGRRDVGLRSYVNCSRNMWEPYLGFRSRFEAAAPAANLHMEVFGPFWGFGCNAVHFLELFRFITGARELACSDARLAASPEGNKRGARFEEFVGTASFCNERGDTLQLTSNADRRQPPGISVLCRVAGDPGFGILVEEDRGLVHQLGGDGTRKFAPAYVSSTTRTFIEAALGDQTHTLPLPTVASAAISHRALFEALALATGREQFAIT